MADTPRFSLPKLTKSNYATWSFVIEANIAAVVASVFIEKDVKFEDIKDKDDRYTTLEFIIEVRDRQHLAHVMRRIRGIKHVSQLSRR